MSSTLLSNGEHYDKGDVGIESHVLHMLFHFRPDCHDDFLTMISMSSSPSKLCSAAWLRVAISWICSRVNRGFTTETCHMCDYVWYLVSVLPCDYMISSCSVAHPITYPVWTVRTHCSLERPATSLRRCHWRLRLQLTCAVCHAKPVIAVRRLLH